MYKSAISRNSLIIVSSGAVASTLLFSSQEPIYNDPKRRFYEDESNIVPIPGTVTPAAGTELKALGPNRLVDGISVRSPSSLEAGFKSIRESLTGAYQKSQGFLNERYTQYYQTERQVTTTVSDLHNKSEDLLPNGIYIVIAALSGNIIARQRGVISKAFFPVALGLASFRYFLPQTFRNTTGFVWKLEEQYVPELAHSQELSIKKTDELVHKIGQTTESSQQSVQSSIQSLRQKIADVTGLNLDGDATKK